MAAGSWISGIQGLTTLLTGNGQTTQRRSVLKVAGGRPIFDDGTQSVLGGVQVITGSGAWDTKSGTILVKGSGARSIAVANPDATLQHEGLELLLIDFAGNATGNNITFTTMVLNGAASPVLNSNFGYIRALWLSSNQWRNVS